jgi:hypothetical protein
MLHTSERDVAYPINAPTIFLLSEIRGRRRSRRLQKRSLKFTIFLPRSNLCGWLLYWPENVLLFYQYMAKTGEQTCYDAGTEQSPRSANPCHGDVPRNLSRQSARPSIQFPVRRRGSRRSCSAISVKTSGHTVFRCLRPG